MSDPSPVTRLRALLKRKNRETFKPGCGYCAGLADAYDKGREYERLYAGGYFDGQDVANPYRKENQ